MKEYINPKDPEFIYKVELRKGGKSCQVFKRPKDGGSRMDTGIPVLDIGRTSLDFANRILTGYKNLLGWKVVEN